jgi:hypothetical protein
MAWGVYSSQLQFEVSIMINVNYVLPHHHIGRRSQRRVKPRNTRCCIRQDQESTPACEDQKDD